MFPKRGAVALVVTALALVLLLSFKTADGGPDLGSSGSAIVEPSPTAVGPTLPSATGSAAPSSGGSRTIDGSLVRTRYGDVEVRITVSAGSVTDIEAVALPTGGRSGQISNYVEPVLASEALAAQSAAIDIVSGATYTSDAYARSLQAALDDAGIAEVVAAG